MTPDRQRKPQQVKVVVVQDDTFLGRERRGGCLYHTSPFAEVMLTTVQFLCQVLPKNCDTRFVF